MPILLVATVGGRELVVKRCREAERRGVCEGRTLAEARAVLGGLGREAKPHVAPLDAAADLAALRSLALLMERFAPTVALDPPDGLLLDVTGCAPLFGGEERLALAVGESVRRLGFSACVAVAPTAGCAWAVARYASSDAREGARHGAEGPRHVAEGPRHVAEGDEREALAALPIGALRVPDATAGALAELGIRTVSDLFPLPRDEVWARFGRELLESLDRATGHASEPLTGVREDPPICVERTFDGPVRDVAAVRGTTRLLLEALCRALEVARRGALEVTLAFRRADGATVREALRVSLATVDPVHLLALLDPRLERLPMGDGIDEISITASRSRRLRPAQTAWVAREDEGGGALDGTLGGEVEVGRLVDTLVERCGPRRVVVFHPVESHWPERAFAAQAPFLRRASAATDVDEAPEAPTGDRPSLLFAQPEAAEVSLDEQARPRAISWRGTTRAVVESVGPERISVPWWDRRLDDPAREAERDYFRVCDEDGRWLWVFENGAPEASRTRLLPRASRPWFVHGEWA